MSVPTKSVAVPALDLKSQYQGIRDEIDAVVRRVIESQMFVQGPEVAQLEAELAAYCGAARGVGCASGTDALLLPLMAMGIGAGDEVITTPYTFFATVGAITGAMIGIVTVGTRVSKPFPFGPALALGGMLALFLIPHWIPLQIH